MARVQVKRPAGEEGEEAEEEERCVSITANLLLALQRGSRRDRVASKFVENEFEKCDRLMEIYLRLVSRVRDEEVCQPGCIMIHCSHGGFPSAWPLLLCSCRCLTMAVRMTGGDVHVRSYMPFSPACPCGIGSIDSTVFATSGMKLMKRPYIFCSPAMECHAGRGGIGRG